MARGARAIGQLLTEVDDTYFIFFCVIGDFDDVKAPALRNALAINAASFGRVVTLTKGISPWSGCR